MLNSRFERLVCTQATPWLHRVRDWSASCLEPGTKPCNARLGSRPKAHKNSTDRWAAGATFTSNAHRGKPNDSSIHGGPRRGAACTRSVQALRQGLNLRIAIVGAGIVGVTTAYELALQGHEVTVYERQSSVASECSFANAGLIAPGYIAPWVAPGRPWKALRGLFGAQAALRLGGANALAQLPWIWRCLHPGRPGARAGQRQALHTLAEFSRQRMLELTRNLHLEFEQTPGFMVLLRGEPELQAAQAGLALLREWGVVHALVDAARCRAIEPGLATTTALHAAIHLPQDGVGNCRQFAHLLKAQAQRMGARFRFDTTVAALKAGSQPIVETVGQPGQAFDAVLVCAGAQANRVLAGVGLKLPLAPVYGYSITAPVRHVDGLPQPGPRAALVDERYKVAISRLGQRIRVAGGAEIGGRPEHLAEGPIRTLYRVLDDWFAGAALTHEAQHWKGACAMLPDGPPVLGESGAPGIWLNLGHGASGWVLACGSARVLAERIAGRPAPLDLAPFAFSRWRT
jgi:D-amino-acid dehydrogenase